MFDVNEEEVHSINKSLAANPRTNDRRICICGHSMSRHNKTDHGCKPVSFDCPCKRRVPILEVKNTRYFIARSIGSGEGHALVRGYMASKAAIPDFEKTVTWIAELKCENDRCGKPTNLYPVITDEHGFRLHKDNEDRGINGIFCETCREIYWDSDRAREIRTERGAIKAVPDQN
jgi:coproporphyrinogen III oxidase